MNVITVIIEKDGWTSIFFAAYQNNVELCNFLLERGADILHVANNGLTAYGAAAIDGHSETAIQLANIALVEALVVGNGDRILEIVSDGADPGINLCICICSFMLSLCSYIHMLVHTS